MLKHAGNAEKGRFGAGKFMLASGGVGGLRFTAMGRLMLVFACVLLGLPSGLRAETAVPELRAEQWQQAQPESIPRPESGGTPVTAPADTLREGTKKAAAADDAVSPKALIVVIVVVAVVLGGLVLSMLP